MNMLDNNIDKILGALTKKPKALPPAPMQPVEEDKHDTILIGEEETITEHAGSPRVENYQDFTVPRVTNVIPMTLQKEPSATSFGMNKQPSASSFVNETAETKFVYPAHIAPVSKVIKAADKEKNLSKVNETTPAL